MDPADIRGDDAFARFPALRAAPDPAAVEAAAAALLRAAERPVIICGGGPVIAGARAEVTALAERLGAAVATSISGQGAILDAHPLALGVVGSNGGCDETRAVVDGADLVVLVGCRAGSVTTERWRHPTPGGAPLIHIDVDPAVIGANYPTDVALLGDARLALAALIEALSGHEATNNASAAVAGAKASKFERFHRLAEEAARPIQPERVVRELSALLPGDSVVVADPGTPCPYLSAY